MERELVFDIDLTDYDDVRTCGKEGHICTKCWPFMAAAVEVRAGPVLPCPAPPCPALPRPALPCPALPCPALPCPALPCPA